MWGSTLWHVRVAYSWLEKGHGRDWDKRYYILEGRNLVFFREDVRDNPVRLVATKPTV